MFYDFLAWLFSGITTAGGGINALNTKKIDGHIRMLSSYDWFRQLYEQEPYRRLFITNRNVRLKLQSSFRVKKLINSTSTQAKFVVFLNKQLK